MVEWGWWSGWLWSGVVVRWGVGGVSGCGVVGGDVDVSVHIIG